MVGGCCEMGIELGMASPVPSLPPPCPRSPPPYPDLYGKRRELAKPQMLEREKGFLEEELKFVECLQPASRCCKEYAWFCNIALLVDYVAPKSDPFIPIDQKITRSCRFWKWLCGSCCYCFPWLCCCNGCSPHLKRSDCCHCDSCNFCSCNTCSLSRCKCCSCPACTCRCKRVSCPRGCCRFKFPFCSSCICSSDCCHCSCSCLKPQKLCPCCSCKKSCCETCDPPCCICY